MPVASGASKGIFARLEWLTLKASAGLCRAVNSSCALGRTGGSCPALLPGKRNHGGQEALSSKIEVFPRAACIPIDDPILTRGFVCGSTDFDRLLILMRNNSNYTTLSHIICPSRHGRENKL